MRNWKLPVERKSESSHRVAKLDTSTDRVDLEDGVGVGISGEWVC